MDIRFTINGGAFGDTGSADVDDEDDEDWPFLISPQKAYCTKECEVSLI
jgi:hypothetical protein